METNKDHTYILCEIDPQFGINKFIRLAKGRSSRILREEFPHLKKIYAWGVCQKNKIIERQ